MAPPLPRHLPLFLYIDNWSPPLLLLVERAVKYAVILAVIKAPAELQQRSIAEQGYDVRDKNYAINSSLAAWLEEHVIYGSDMNLVTPAPVEEKEDDGLAGLATGVPQGIERAVLRAEGTVMGVREMEELVKEKTFLKAGSTPAADLQIYLVDNGDGMKKNSQATKTGVCRR